MDKSADADDSQMAHHQKAEEEEGEKREEVPTELTNVPTAEDAQEDQDVQQPKGRQIYQQPPKVHYNIRKFKYGIIS